MQRSPVAQPEPTTVLYVDARHPADAPRTDTLRMGAGRAPDGRTIGVDSRSLTLDGKPWLPVMGEFHYTRVPEAHWDDELAKVKAAGVEIVATYVVWRHHEAHENHFDWSGRRDLRRFVDLCSRHGLFVFARIGPWAHAEVRYGGMPDWIVNQMPTRGDDPVYLGYVQRFYLQISAQLHGMLWKEGGPVIGIQLENEYNLTGHRQGAEHIATLKKLAQRAGLDAPLYTVTGWDDAVFPRGEVTPVFGGYPDLPWGTSTEASPPSEVYAFRFTSRVGGDLGTQTKGERPGERPGDADAVAADTPFLGAEFGGGLPTMYRRRPVLDPDDVAAMLPVQLGSGVNLYGYYMFHGGRNPPGDLHGQESTATGGWNDLPVIGYDFQAPFGANGEAHPVLGKLRPMHWFLHDWGSALASYAVYRPELTPHAADDLHTPRFSVRGDGEQAFLFFNNHVRQHAMAAQRAVRFTVDLATRKVTFPIEPVDIPSGAWFVWPVELPLGDARLRYATAQPVTRLTTPEGETYLFGAVDGIAPEFAFDARGLRGIRALNGNAQLIVRDIDGALIVRPSCGEPFVVTSSSGRRVTVLALSQRDVEQATVLSFAGERRVVLTEATAFVSNGQLVLRSMGRASFGFAVYPPLGGVPFATQPVSAASGEGVFQRFVIHASTVAADVQITPVRAAQDVPPVMQGGPANVAIEPLPETFGKSAAWRIDFPSAVVDSKGISNVLLSIRYTGDIARLFSGADLIDDEYYTGLPWQVGLRNVAFDPARPLTLTVLPLRSDAPIYLDARFDPRSAAHAQVASLQSVSLIAEYEVRIGDAASP